MSEMLLTEEEFLAQLEAEETKDTPKITLVFMPPKLTDRGYHARRKATIALMTRQSELEMAPGILQTEGAKIVADGDALTKEIDEAKSRLEAARKKAAEALTAETFEASEAEVAQLEQALKELGKREEAFVERALKIADELKGIGARQAALLDEKIEFLLPFVRGHKIASETPGSPPLYRARPYGGEELEEFLDVSRRLLAEESEESFTSMMNAAAGIRTAKDAQPVPPKNAGR